MAQPKPSWMVNDVQVNAITQYCSKISDTLGQMGSLLVHCVSALAQQLMGACGQVPWALGFQQLKGWGSHSWFGGSGQHVSVSGMYGNYVLLGHVAHKFCNTTPTTSEEVMPSPTNHTRPPMLQVWAAVS